MSCEGDLSPSPSLLGTAYIQVSVVSLVIYRNVYVDDIPLFERSVVGDAMTNHLIDAGTHRFGEFVVIQRRWICLPLHCKVYERYWDSEDASKGAYAQFRISSERNGII